MRKVGFALLLLFLLGGFIIRLYRFDNPIADWHSWRQADTSAVSRNFVKYGFDVLHPRIDNISNVQSGMDNPQGYFFAEFPLFNLFQAGGFVLFHIFTIEEWGRVISICSSIVGMIFVYLLTKRHGSTIGALAAVFFYAFLPFAIYYGRTILPDSLGTAFLLSGIYTFDRWLENSKFKIQKSRLKVQIQNYSFLILSILLTACALLVRPHLIFYTTVFVYLVWRQWKFAFLKKWQVYVFAILVLLPFGLWRLWMTQYPEGIPVSAWLFNEGNIRFTGAFFYWLFAERLGKLILGYWGVMFLVLGLLWKGKQGWGFFVSFFLGSLIYLTVIARGNVQHDYYQYITIPSIIMLMGRGVDFLFNLPRQYVNRFMVYGVVGVVSIFSLAFGWYYIRDYFNVNNWSIVRAGEAVDQLTPRNAKVIAPYDGDSSFLYQTNRFGWASFEKGLSDMVSVLGADYLVLVNPKPADYNIGKQYKIVSANSDYILFNLREKSNRK